MGKKIFVDLTHPFSAEIPRWPYFDKPEIDNAHTMAKGGVLTQKITCTMHTGTHCDAPRHVMEYEFDGRRARYTHEMPVDAYTGDAVCIPIDIEPWGLIEPKHLEAGCEKAGIRPSELEGMVLCLETGSTSCLTIQRPITTMPQVRAKRRQVVCRRKVKCVAMDSQGPGPSASHGNG